MIIETSPGGEDNAAELKQLAMKMPMLFRYHRTDPPRVQTIIEPNGISRGRHLSTGLS